MSPSLPPELWRSIFRETVQVPLVLDTEWNYGPDERIWEGWGDTWDVDIHTQMRQSIVQVCRQWRELGSEFLYEILNLESLPSSEYHRLYTLLDIFETSSLRSEHGYGWWTKRIVCPGLLLKSQEHAYMLFFLLEHCHNLQSFSTQRVSLPMATLNRLDRTLQSRFAHSLKRIEIWPGGPTSDIDNPIPLASLLPHIRLTTLYLTILQENLPHLHASFEHITTLTLVFLYQYQRTVVRWFFPRLKTLALYDTGHNEDFLHHVPFIKRHKRKLINLFIENEIDDASTLTSHLPDLRTLAMGHHSLSTLSDRQKGGQILPMVGLTHLGLVLGDNFSASTVCDSMISLLETEVFPSMRVVRLLTGPDFRSMRGSDWGRLFEVLHQRNIRLENTGRLLNQ